MAPDEQARWLTRGVRGIGAASLTMWTLVSPAAGLLFAAALIAVALGFLSRPAALT